MRVRTWRRTTSLLAHAFEGGMASLHERLAAEMAERAAQAAAAPPEPDAPGSMDRELREPVSASPPMAQTDRS